MSDIKVNVQPLDPCDKISSYQFAFQLMNVFKKMCLQQTHKTALVLFHDSYLLLFNWLLSQGWFNFLVIIFFTLQVCRANYKHVLTPMVALFSLIM